MGLGNTLFRFFFKLIFIGVELILNFTSNQIIIKRTNIVTNSIKTLKKNPNNDCPICFHWWFCISGNLQTDTLLQFWSSHDSLQVFPNILSSIFICEFLPLPFPPCSSPPNISTYPERTCSSVFVATYFSPGTTWPCSRPMVRSLMRSPWRFLNREMIRSNVPFKKDHSACKDNRCRCKHEIGAIKEI